MTNRTLITVETLPARATRSDIMNAAADHVEAKWAADDPEDQAYHAREGQRLSALFFQMKQGERYSPRAHSI